MTARITIAQLYAELLGVTGDRGNVEVLRTRAERAGLSADVVLVDVGQDLPDADIVVIGNGPLSAMRGIVDDLRRHTTPLAAHIAAGRGLLAIGGGAELLGGEISLSTGGTLAGLGTLPFRTERRAQRRVGYLVADAAGMRLVGFEDHSSLWHLDDGIAPFALVAEGKGTSDLADGARGEGVRSGNAIALRMQGPVLPLNPALADLLLARAAAEHDVAYSSGDAHADLDAFAREARAAIEARARSKTYSTIGI
ncbi:glutamine amidotransferase [Microbacterium ulmi]|uniref:Lipid II isoglutaminyl synthase (glutamine-hydrolyzing) subunit GatD n=1 Tax=Microbacterium ulmi TaxID=179095 RepID=A0A7Y2M339_9MICO|nr:glutamine amidotransferase [Microbacterium ulmi]NII71030.1 hypothetical protein [Microbacterium ulmi]NNH04203.1 glutamine amidotransferase [Microbacterium ulmi]